MDKVLFDEPFFTYVTPRERHPTLKHTNSSVVTSCCEMTTTIRGSPVAYATLIFDNFVSHIPHRNRCCSQIDQIKPLTKPRIVSILYLKVERKRGTTQWHTYHKR